MHRDYQRWYSHRLNRDMGVAMYGNYGWPLLAFPTSCGDEWEQEGQGMIRTLKPYLEQWHTRIGESFRSGVSIDGWPKAEIVSPAKE